MTDDQKKHIAVEQEIAEQEWAWRWALVAAIQSVAAELKATREAQPLPSEERRIISEKRRAAGRLGAAAVKRGESGTFAPKQPSPANTGKTPAKEPAKNRQGDRQTTGKPPAKARQPTGKSNLVWATYQAAYVKRYGVSPLPRDQASSTMLCRMIDQMGEQATCRAVEFYLRHNEPFYVKAAHPISLFYRDRAKMHKETQTGQATTTRQANQAEVESSIDESFKRLQERQKARAAAKAQAAEGRHIEDEEMPF